MYSRRTTYHLWPSDLHDLSITGPQRSLATDHGAAVTQHQDADERIAVGVPANDRLIILPWTASDALIIGIGLLLLLDHSQFALGLLLGLDRDIDVANLKVKLWNQIYTSNLGDDGKSLWVVPCIVDEWCVSKLMLDTDTHLFQG